MSHKSSAWLVSVAGLATWVAASTAAAQVPMPDDELARHLTTIRSQLENVTIDLARREELALEMAATLDRAAQSAPDANVRRRRWSEAIDLLDWFLEGEHRPAAGTAGAVSGGRLAVGAGSKLGRDRPCGPARSKNRVTRPCRARQRDRAISSGHRGREQPDPDRQPAVSAGGSPRRSGRSRPGGSADRRSTREAEALRSARPGPGRDRPGRLLAPAQGRPLAPARETGRGRARDRRSRQGEARSATARDRRGQYSAIDRAESDMTMRSSRSMPRRSTSR